MAGRPSVKSLRYDTGALTVRPRPAPRFIGGCPRQKARHKPATRPALQAPWVAEAPDERQPGPSAGTAESAPAGNPGRTAHTPTRCTPLSPPYLSHSTALDAAR